MPHPIEWQIVDLLGLLGLVLCWVSMARLRAVLIRFDATTPTPPPPAGSGQQLGLYTLGDKIGEGATGQVYRAWHRRLQRWCAIKLLPREVSEHELRRFEREVRLTAQLSHPNTVSIYDYDRAPDGSFYYAMELLEGVSLEELVHRHGPQPAGRVIHILRQLCWALTEAHAHGLIHRDIKPSNVLLCRRGGRPDVAKLLDFGLVQQLGAGKTTSQSSKLLVGTPLYMSPEAITAPELMTPRSDLYALGAVAHFLLTGATVFDGGSLVEVCAQHLHAVPERPSRVLGRAIAGDLESVVLECLEKNPLQRPGSAAELEQRLACSADAGTWTQTDAESWWRDPASSGIRRRAEGSWDHHKTCA